MELRDFAFHMKSNKTGEKRIKKVKAVDVTHAFCSDVGYGKEWTWTGSEPWHNVADQVEHIGRGYYRRRQIFDVKNRG